MHKANFVRQPYIGKNSVTLFGAIGRQFAIQMQNGHCKQIRLYFFQYLGCPIPSSIEEFLELLLEKIFSCKFME
jgi:hypothetical protein